MSRRWPVSTIWMTCGALCLSACASDPPPPPPSWSERAAARPAARPVAAPPRGIDAPVDRWRERLAARVPAPWTLQGIEAQVEAPPGWTRLGGDRGLVLWFEDGAQRQGFWLLPRGFDGKVYDPAQAAEVRATSDDFVLFGPRVDRPGWGATDAVVEALELK
ncbi:MAG: hypothetical protein KF878_27520 [Planctomycetes bacterium]|nr:hypothetical protein [Planctomycetota bacterium]